MNKSPVSDEVVIRQIDIDRDAADLAEMWQASELAWPNGWNRGIPVTSEMVREWEEEERLLATYVAEIDGKAVGYCSFQKGEDESEGEAYLSLLNVHPGYHGHSIGRKLIQATIERSVTEGFQYQTLHTWSANFKAVPAYKKTGHFWAPDSSVLMENFVPGALQLSVAKQFFEKHDWYSCFVRELDQSWDKENWSGLEVYTYRWAADGEELVLRYDRHARGLVSVETSALELSAVVDRTKPIAGTTVTMNWQAVNKSLSDTVSFTIRAGGEKGLDIDHVEQFCLEPGESRLLTAPVKIVDDAPSLTDKGTWPAVLTDWLVDDQRVMMRTGVKPGKSVSLGIFPEMLSTCPGKALTASIEIENKQDKAASLDVRLLCDDGLCANWQERVVTVPPNGHVALPVTLVADKEDVLRLSVHVDAPLSPVDETFKVFSVAAGGLTFDRGTKSIRVESDNSRFKFEAKQGNITVEEKSSEMRLGVFRLTVAPPFDREFKDLELDARYCGPRVIVSMKGQAKHRKGLLLSAEIVISATGLGVIRAELQNKGSQVYDTSLCLAVDVGDRDRLRMAHPACRIGILAPSTHYPSGTTDELRCPSDYAEPWLVWDRQDVPAGSVAGGVAWDSLLQQIMNEWRVYLVSRRCHIKPGDKTQAMGFACCAMQGTWQNAVDVLRGWTGTSSELPFGPAVRVIPAKAPVLTVSDRVESSAEVYSISKRRMDGKLSLQVTEGARIEPDTFALEGVIRGNAPRCVYAIELGEKPQGVYEITSRLELPTEEQASTASIVRVGTEHDVEVSRSDKSGREVWVVDNGADCIVIAPDFGPSVISWTHKHQEMLQSAFPEPEGFAWSFPFHGGIHPLLKTASSHMWEGYLHREEVQAQSLKTIWQGLDWCGVRLSCQPVSKNLKGLAVELDYTMMGESSLLRVVYRLRNLRPTSSAKLTAGHSARFSLADDCCALTGYGPGVVRHPTNQAAHLAGQPWVAVSRIEKGTTAVLVSLNKDAALFDHGQYGRLLASESEVRLEGNQTLEFTSFYVLASDLEDALRYRVLGDIGTVS